MKCILRFLFGKNEKVAVVVFVFRNATWFDLCQVSLIMSKHARTRLTNTYQSSRILLLFISPGISETMSSYLESTKLPHRDNNCTIRKQKIGLSRSISCSLCVCAFLCVCVCDCSRSHLRLTGIVSESCFKTRNRCRVSFCYIYSQLELRVSLRPVFEFVVGFRGSVLPC